MANKKISQLTERTKLTGNEMLPFQEGNYNGKIRSSLLTSLSGSGDDLQKIRSTKGQIVASSGNGIIRNVIHDNNQYYLKFDEPISYVVGDILNCTTYSENNKKNYSLVIQNIEKNYIIISESQYEQSKPQIGDETVQIGNTNNEKRAGIVTLTAAPNENIGLDCYSDIYTTNSDGQLRVRVGYLNGIYDSFFPEDGQPNGYGLYGNNCFLVGDFLLRDGSNITNLIEDLRFEISDIINETNALNNYLSNASFSNNLDKWQYGNNIKVFRVSQKLLYFNNNFYSNKEAITALTKENNRNAVKLKNSYIMQYNTDYDRHPEFNEKVARLFNIQFRYKVLRPGILTICFKNEDTGDFEEYEKINYTQQLNTTSIFNTLNISGKWNGTGDFYLSFTGDILIHSVVLYDDELGNLKEYFDGQLQITNEKIQANYDKIIETTNRLEEYHSEFLLTAENLRVEFEKKISNTKNEITEEYTSAINLSAEELTVDFNKKITDAKQEITSEYTSAIELSAEELTVTFDQKVTHLDETLEEYHSEFTLSAQEFTTRFEKNEESITGLEESTEELTQTTTSISTQVSEISQDLNSITLRVASTESNITTLVNKTNGIEEINNKQEETISSIKLSLDNINLSITQNSTEINTLKDTTNNLKQTTTNIQKQVSEIDLNIDSILLRVSNTEQDIVTITNKTNNLEKTDAKQQEDISQIKLEIGNINLSVSSNTNEISSLKNKTTGLEQTTQTITEQISEINLDIDAITLRVSKNESNITNLEGKTNTISSDVAQIKLDTKKIESNVTSISSKVNSNTGRIEAIEAESAGWVTTAEGNTLWAAKGQTEEDIKTAKNAAESAASAAAEAAQKANSAQTAADDAASDAATAYSKATSAQSTANSAARTANSAYNLANSANNKATANATAIKQNSDYISLIAGNFDSDGDIINAAGWITTSEGNTLWARKELENGNTIVSYINQTATTVDISAEKINFIGKTVINGKFIVDTSGNVTLNNLTANDGTFNGTINATLGKIGAFRIDQYGLYDSDSAPGAYLSIGSSTGIRFFRVNSNLTSAMCEIRTDGETALNILTYGTKGDGIHVTSNSNPGYAINSHGNVLLEARNGEFITIHGLTLNVKAIKTNYTILTSDDYIECDNSNAITLTLPTPSSSKGKIYIFNFLKTSGVTLKGTLKLFNNKIEYSHKWSNTGKRIFISNGTYWVEYMYQDN